MAAEAFLKAVYEGDPGAIWSSFSTEARNFVVARGVRRGMPYDLGQALLDNSADILDEVDFLAELLGGIEKDLETIDLGRISVSTTAEFISDHKVRVRFSEEFVIEVGPPLEALPVGSLELVEEGQNWKIDRLIPRPG